METKLIDIGTAKLETCLQGEKGPIVVIETGMGDSFYNWNIISKKIASKVRVLMYHRQGYGKSTLTEEPCTTEKIAKDLMMLLEKMYIEEPIILVGHSFGGLCALHFAKLFPNKLLGLILVDSSPVEYYKLEELKERLRSIQTKYPTTKALETMKKYSNMTEYELLKEINPTLSTRQLEFSNQIQEKIKDFSINSNLWKAQVSEFENMIDSGKTIEALGNLSNIILKVIGRDGKVEISNLTKVGILEDEAKEFEELIQKYNKAKVDYSTNGEFILAKGVGHKIHIDCPDIIIKTIEKLI